MLLLRGGGGGELLGSDISALEKLLQNENVVHKIEVNALCLYR